MTFDVSVKTNETATCKLDMQDKDYDAMGVAMTSKENGTKHTIKVFALNNSTYKIYVRCKDAAGNKNNASTIITFTVNTGGTDTTPPTISDPKPTDTVSSNSIKISVITNENATCKYDTADTDFAAMESTFDTTGGTTHSSDLMMINDGDYTIYVRCKDAAGNETPSSTRIEFTVDTSGGTGDDTGDTGNDTGDDTGDDDTGDDDSDEKSDDRQFDRNSD